MAPRGRGSRWVRAAPWAALAFGLAITAVLDSTIVGTLARRHREEFDREVARVQGAIAEAVRRQVSVVEATAGLVSADPELDQAAFSRFYERLARGKDAGKVEALGLTLGRPWARRGELAAEAARRGAAPYRLRPGDARPQANAVVLIAPQDPANAEAPGFDMRADPIRRVAMDRALRRDRATLTSAVYLAKDKGRRIPSFLFYLPVRRLEGGLVFSAVHANRLFEDVFTGDANAAEMGLRLGPGTREAAFERPLRAPRFRSALDIPLPEVASSLRAEITASAEFGTQATVRPFIVPAGTVLSLLLFLLAANLRSAHEDTARRAAEQGLLAEVGRLTAGEPDGDGVLREIAHRAADTLDAVCRIDLLEAGGLRTVTTRVADGSTPARLERDDSPLTSDPLLQRAIETAATQRLISASAGDAGPVLVVPLAVGERVLGGLTLARRRRQPEFSPEAVGLAEAIAGRMALAIENERLARDLERRVAERTRDLEASNHELESFCYSVSHDLRTPLRSLDGFGRVLEEDYGGRLDDQGLEYLARIRSATRRMDELITALLTLSRLTRREILPQEVDVTRLVCDAMRELDPSSRVRLTVEEDLGAWADPRMAAVVFDNLLGNAVKFSARSAEPEIVVGRDGDGWTFVRDNGAGFDMAYAAKLFQPFERLHSVREFPGHGIGLATVERIVRRHGGDLRAEGRPGEGATFYVRFPGEAARSLGHRGVPTT